MCGFYEGDLVVHKQKVKMRVLGSFVIKNLSPKSVVRQNTSSDQMTNFINGNYLKKYKEPLIQEMLTRLHIGRKQWGYVGLL